MPTRFWLNDHLIDTDAPPGLLLLDFIRERRGLTGTKEGCKEGDCGACAVLIGRLEGDRVRYEPVTSCLVPLGEMEGRHVVTVEGVNMPRGGLNPVQQAMVEFGGAQCGFCTPGFVVSMVWYLLAEQGDPDRAGFQRAISGNLCRCTGYGAINRASDSLVEKFGPGGAWHGVWAAEDRVAAMVDAAMLPAYFTEMPSRLKKAGKIAREALPGIAEAASDADFVIAGGTDVYVQRGEEVPGSQIAALNRYPQLRGIRLEDGAIHAGALTTFEELRAHPQVRALLPAIDEHMFLIASLHIRNRATLGGNIVNASPIGDVTNLLLAMGAELLLERDGEQRRVPMREFFLGYKVRDQQPGELLTEVIIPAAGPQTRASFEKIAKRKALDIATVCSGARFELSDDGQTIAAASISMGGVAPIPLLLRKTGDFLAGKPVSAQSFGDALPIALSEIAPISDVRGSAAYKRLLTRQLLIAHATRLFGDRIAFADFAAPAAPAAEASR